MLCVANFRNEKNEVMKSVCGLVLCLYGMHETICLQVKKHLVHVPKSDEDED